MIDTPRLDITSIHAAYENHETTPADLCSQLWEAAQNAPNGIWIQLATRENLDEQLRVLAGKSREDLPLFGVPFAVKDNIDVRGFATTAACEAFKDTPQRDAFVVQQLRDAGAICLGKTNLDQFATGLSGTRSPFGICRNALKSEYIAGGSSSGSAVVVALGLVSFALGTDTAGSGRVPAALNNVVGHKPTRGIVSMSGVVPACRSLDTISVFASTCDDAARVLAASAHFDESDAFARRVEKNGLDFPSLPVWKLGVPDAKSLQFFGDENAAQLFDDAISQARRLGAEIVEVDFAPFLEAANLLYEGPWVAERFRVVRELLQSQPDALLEVTRNVIEKGAQFSAVEVFENYEKLAALKRICDRAWHEVDAIFTPTIPRACTIEEMLSDPVSLNSNLGYYTNFMNLLDYCALALPAGFHPSGLPFGITIFATAQQDEPLLHFGARWQAAKPLALGALSQVYRAREYSQSKWDGAVSLAVCGAHMSGLPLNVQLRERGAKLVSKVRSAPIYKFYALPDGPPHRPGMVRVESGGAKIEMEVWSVPIKAFGSFVAGIPAPLGIGIVELENGEKVPGFVCEAIAANGARDITEFGSWRAFLASQNV